MAKYISIPTEIEAEFVGNFEEGNLLTLWKLVGNDENILDTYWVDTMGPKNVDCIRIFDKLHMTWINVYKNQWIIRGTKGEYYPCDPEVFEAKYKKVD